MVWNWILKTNWKLWEGGVGGLLAAASASYFCVGAHGPTVTLYITFNLWGSLTLSLWCDTDVITLMKRTRSNRDTHKKKLNSGPSSLRLQFKQQSSGGIPLRCPAPYYWMCLCYRCHLVEVTTWLSSSVGIQASGKSWRVKAIRECRHTHTHSDSESGSSVRL